MPVTTTFIYVLTILAVTLIAASALVQIVKPNVDVTPYAAGAGVVFVLLCVVYFTSHDPLANVQVNEAQNLGIADNSTDPVQQELERGSSSSTPTTTTPTHHELHLRDKK